MPDAARIQNKVLACVDHSAYADHVADHAAWAARRMSAPLEFLHVIDRVASVPEHDHSGAIGVSAQEKLLDELSAEDEARSREAREQGRLFLNRLRERAVGAGVESVDMRQRHGDLVEALTEQEEGVRLIVLGRRGAAAQATRRDLGRNVERIVRALHKPILAVTEGFAEPQRVMIAFDGGVVTRRGVQMVAASPLFRNLPVHLLMVGNATNEARREVEWAREALCAAGFAAESSLQPGDAETVIARTIRDQAIDLLVMGAYGHSPLRSLLFGSKTTDLLRSAPIPTLLLRG